MYGLATIIAAVVLPVAPMPDPPHHVPVKCVHYETRQVAGKWQLVCTKTVAGKPDRALVPRVVVTPIPE